ncbi:hypothetical protein VN97_g1995 [Penicillium thymicola]|uniref:Uncharacterized protein n=1 Tax=Penicillium thymicola TaxID=293382 RepID=A0AAI9TQF9_PENTH|nr:hypothetical protein VN97_g1995 [Penicillium thymicola]
MLCYMAACWGPGFLNFFLHFPQPPLLSALYCFVFFNYYYYLCLTVRGSLFSKISTPSCLHHGCHLYFNSFRLDPSF